MDEPQKDEVISNPKPVYFMMHLARVADAIRKLVQDNIPSHTTNLGSGQVPRWTKSRHITHTSGMRAKAVREGRRSFKVSGKVRKI